LKTRRLIFILIYDKTSNPATLLSKKREITFFKGECGRCQIIMQDTYSWCSPTGELSSFCVAGSVVWTLFFCCDSQNYWRFSIEMAESNRWTSEQQSISINIVTGLVFVARWVAIFSEIIDVYNNIPWRGSGDFFIWIGTYQAIWSLFLWEQILYFYLYINL
jgi:hypothetical protein